MSTFGGLDTLFNPAKRHLDEEKLRLQSTREEVGDASGGQRIDLDSGRVKIARGQSGDGSTDGDEVAAESLTGDDPADDPDTPTVATTAGTVRADADADADPAAEESHDRTHARATRRRTATGARTTAADEENTPAARARRRRAHKA